MALSSCLLPSENWDTKAPNLRIALKKKKKKMLWGLNWVNILTQNFDWNKAKAPFD